MELELEAQGTELRVLAPGAATSATFGQASTVVTVTDADHGMATGDRIDVLTAADGTGVIGRASVTVIDEDTFSFVATGTETVAAGAALTYKRLLAISPKTISGPGGSASVIDATTLSSKAKQKRMGLADEGQIQFTVHYVPGNAAHEALRAARAARTHVKLELAFTDEAGTYWSFDGYVLSFPVSMAVDGLVESQVTVEIDGEITEY